MIEIRFHRDLYSEEALAEAIDRYVDYAHIERETTDTAFVVRVEPKESVDGEAVADELGNYVLGATIERMHG